MLNLNSLSFNEEYTLWFECSRMIPSEIASAWEPNSILHLLSEQDMYTSDKYLLFYEKQDGIQDVVELSVRGLQETEADFKFMMSKNVYYFPLFRAFSPDRKEIEIRFIFFYGDKISVDIDIALTPRILKKLAERENVTSDKQMKEFFADNFQVTYNGKKYYLIDRNSEQDVNFLINSVEKKLKHGFSILGNNGYRLLVGADQLGERWIYSAFALRADRYGETLYSASVLSGDIVFKRQRELIKSIQDEQIAKRYKDDDSYFKNWDEYTDAFLDLVLNRVRELGWYQIKEVIPGDISKGEYEIELSSSVHTDKSPSFVDSGLQNGFWICDQIPVFFEENEMTGRMFLDYCLNRPAPVFTDQTNRGEESDNIKDVDDTGDVDEAGNVADTEDVDDAGDVGEQEGSGEQEEKVSGSADKEKENTNRTPKYGRRLYFPGYFARYKPHSVSRDGLQITVTHISHGRIAAGKYICIAMQGELTSTNRSIAARERIRMGKSANPQLRALIEDTDVFHEFGRRNRKHIDALDDFVLQKIYPPNQGPTDNQRKAIELALNTPDILLIQGPPGTGKTTVITAIVERINILRSKAKSNRGEVLVSSYQHAAVDNITSRLSVNDLPSKKTGGKKRLDDHSDEFFEDELDHWINQKLDAIAEKYPEIEGIKGQHAIEELLLKYKSNSTSKNALQLLTGLSNFCSTAIKEKLIRNQSEFLLFGNKIKMLENRYSFAGKVEVGELFDRIPLIRAIRTTKETFLDDGNDRAYQLLSSKAIKDSLTAEEKEILEKASDWYEGDPLDFLPDLAKLKVNLLQKAVSVPTEFDSSIDDELTQLYVDICETAHKQRVRGSSEINGIMSDFYYSLQTERSKIKDDLDDYTLPFAATVQQADGTEMREVKSKGLPYRSDELVYDTVIIDEAARANPPDLLIPMAQGRKRIILVGDHRQLPHIIDEAVLEQNEKDSEESETTFRIDKSVLAKSLFEQLYERLNKLDDFPRVIMLDTQFRMHPLLGNFVSKWFYEVDGEKGFKSVLPVDKFQHHLADVQVHGVEFIPHLEDMAAVWYDVQGEPDRKTSTGSRERECEATAIARKLKAWMDSNAGKKLSFGIITFYAAQRDLINDELQKMDIVDQNGIPLEGYRWLEKEKNGQIIQEERLQVGTVDAFQGKEFDIVLLSVVRATAKHGQVSGYSGKGLFGRICTSDPLGVARNLLCVAMSRQKKLLTIFGDKKLFSSAEAEKHSRELKAMLKICETKDNGKYERL